MESEKQSYLAKSGYRVLTNNWWLIKTLPDTTILSWHIKEAADENASVVDFINTPSYIAITTANAMYVYDKVREKRHIFNCPNTYVCCIALPQTDPRDVYTLMVIDNKIRCVHDIEYIDRIPALSLGTDAKHVVSMDVDETYCDDVIHEKYVQIHIAFSDGKETTISCRIPYSHRCGRGLKFLKTKWKAF